MKFWIWNITSQDLVAAQERVNKAEVQAKNLRDEKAMLKEVEIRLTQEKESMIREHRSQALLLTNLQQIQVGGLSSIITWTEILKKKARHVKDTL